MCLEEWLKDIRLTNMMFMYRSQRNKGNKGKIIEPELAGREKIIRLLSRGEGLN